MAINIPDNLPSIISAIFGANWRPRAAALFTFTTGYIYLHPALFHAIPQPYQDFLYNLFCYMAGGGALTTTFLIKGSNVTGGTTPATPEAAARVAEDKPATPLAPMIPSQSTSTNQGNK